MILPSLRHSICAALVIGLLAAAPAAAADWPTYRHDVARSGITVENLSWPLKSSWAFRARVAPQPAWGDPKPVPIEEILELRRVHFDDVFQVVAADGAVCFGSSGDNKVYCLDAATGRIRWTRITGGPVRLAPTLYDGRVYVASDDGWAYCWKAADGSDLWKFRAAPEDRRVLGHGRMISLWPSRTGVLVDGGVAYVGAGFFPAEGVFLYALNAADGRVLWRNDATGEKPQSRVTPQGYLLASPAMLYAPMGRLSPAAFDRRDGRLLYETSGLRTSGGTNALLAGTAVYTGTEQVFAFDQQTRDKFATFPGRKIIVADAAYYVASNTHLLAMDRKTKATPWKTRCTAADELILAGDVLVAGGASQVLAVRAATGEIVWQTEVDGAAKGLSVAGGRLLVSTDKGLVYSFGPADVPAHGEVREPISPPGASPLSSLAARAAATILEQTKVRRGYCLVWGCETGHLALELAKRSQLMIYAVSPDANKVTAARKLLAAAGVYGDRVCVEQWPLNALPYSDYFANLVVSETALVTGQWPGDSARVVRMVKPLGGTILIGQPEGGGAGGKRLEAGTVRGWLEQPELAGGQLVEQKGVWLKYVRGALPGAGNWTHQYANAGNTACSDDQVVKAPLGVLWFGRPGAGDMMNRHERAASPLSFGGRLIVQGENVIMAYDAYNGLELWRREIAGAQRANASHDGGNIVVCEQGLLVAIGNQCLRLDLDTGETRATYEGLPATPGTPATPGKPATPGFQRWGTVMTEGGLLFGTRSAGAGLSNALFAIDVASGQRRWLLDGQRLLHTTLTAGGDLLFIVSADLNAAQRESALREQRAAIQRLPESERAAAEAALAKPLLRLVLAVDKMTGQVRWQRPLDLTHCGPNLAAMYQDGVLTLFGAYLDGHYWKEFFAGQFASRQVLALDARDGKTLWSQPVGFRVRPVIIGDTLHAEPWAFDLRTGQPRMRPHPVTGEEQRWQFARPGHHCGCPSACAHALFFRSWNMGYFPLDTDDGVRHFGGQRPGCWINCIPAAGLLLMPESSTGCMCDFPNHCTVVFQPTQQDKAWGWSSAPGPTRPVKQLALNLGAPGDRRDASGRLWLGFPRPGGSLVMKVDGYTAFYPKGQFVLGNSVYAEVTGADTPWLFGSVAEGLRKLTLPLLNPGDGEALFRVRLTFADPVHSAPGQRVFDIRLQGRVVAAGYDLAREAGGRNRAVTAEFGGIPVSDRLTLELVAKDAKAPLANLPLLHGIETIRERFTRLGSTPPRFVVNRFKSEYQGVLQLANLSDRLFEGKLQIGTVPGLRVAIPSESVRVAAGQRVEIPVTLTVGELQAGQYAVPFQLVRSDGTMELTRQMSVEHLGTRARAVFAAVEDAHVAQRYPTRNTGTAAVLLVDGGIAAMNDADHTLALLKFRWKLPGTPVSAKLRIVNAGNPTGDGGRVCLAEGEWSEAKVTYANRPKIGRELARLGASEEDEVVERPLALELPREGELSLAIDPTSLDGVDYVSREGGQPAQLTIEYEVEK
jgi:outer membrane protein assembly factor BamB